HLGHHPARRRSVQDAGARRRGRARRHGRLDAGRDRHRAARLRSPRRPCRSGDQRPWLRRRPARPQLRARASAAEIVTRSERMTPRSGRPVAIVTGAGRGIGAAIARGLATDGCAVAVNYAADAAAAAKIVADIAAAGGTATAIQADVAQEADVMRLFQMVERELGAPTALVNNGGITGGFSRVEDLSAATLARVFAVNVIGTILCCREAVRRMSTRRGGAGGSIVNIS